VSRSLYYCYETESE